MDYVESYKELAAYKAADGEQQENATLD